jgi:hypothetical protein
VEIVKLLPWQESKWIDEISAWCNGSLKNHKIEWTSELTLVHSAPWSVVYSVPTTKGLYYFKALCPALKYEPLLTQQLSIWQPGIVQSVLEIEPARGWMLMPDGGSTLRQVLETDLSLNYWKKILPAYARFQQAMIPHQQALLALGVKDRRLSVLPGLAKNLSEDRDAMCIGLPDGLSPAEYDTFLNMLPKLHSLCDRLSQFEIPETLQHDDFHDGNIFALQNGYRFFDWAESFIAHPFFTLVVTLRSISYRFELQDNSPEIRELEDIYLKEWLDYASLDRLHEALDLAMVLGRINRALTWHMVVSSLPEPYRSQQADAVPGWIQLFLEKIIPYA